MNTKQIIEEVSMRSQIIFAFLVTVGVMFTEHALGQESMESEIHGILVDEAGKPEANAEVYAYVKYDRSIDGIDSTHVRVVEVGELETERVKIVVKTKTDKAGKFSLRVKQRRCRLRFLPDRHSGKFGGKRIPAVEDFALGLKPGKSLDLGTLKLSYRYCNLDLETFRKDKVEDKNDFSSNYKKMKALILREGHVRPVTLKWGLEGHYNHPKKGYLGSKGHYILISFDSIATDKYMILANDGMRYSGWYYQKSLLNLKNDYEMKIPLRFGRSHINLELTDINGKRIKENVLIQFSPKRATCEGTLPTKKREKFSYRIPFFETESKAGLAKVVLPRGEWYVSAIVKGVRYALDGDPNNSIQVTKIAEIKETLTLSPRAREAKTGKISGVFNGKFAGHSLKQWAKYRKNASNPAFFIGVYAIPLDKAGRCLINTTTPNVVIDPLKSNKFEIANLPTGRYRVFFVGVHHLKLWHEEVSTYLIFPEAWPAVSYGDVILKGSQTVSVSIQENIALKDFVKNICKSSGIPEIPELRRMHLFVDDLKKNQLKAGK
jgi:hypothetical protein